MRRADGLLAMVHAHSQQALAPANGGDRPRIVVTLSYDKLAKQCTDAGLTRTGEKLPASVVRQLLCDADLLPAVLNGKSEPLDVGRTQRLVTPPIRAALELRDGGCIFPGYSDGRWQVRIHNGTAEIVPPKRVDANQRPRVHARFATRG